MAAILAGEAAVRIVPTLKNFHSEVRKGLKSQPHSLEVKVNPNLKEADAQMAEWRRRQELESVKVPVRADFQSFRKDLSQVEHIFERSSLSKAIRINLVVLGLDALPALAYAAGSAASGLDALAKSSLALPGILGGALASAGALATGIHGVKDAFQAYKQDSDAATESSRKQQDADRDLTSAKRNLQDAIRDQKREMEDLNAEMRRSSLNEAEAVLSIQDDVDRLRKGGFKSVTEYQRAQLSLLQDTDRLSEVRRKNNRTIEDANKANSQGVYQSQKVQEALDRVAKATEALDESKLTKVSQALAKLSPNAAATVQALHGLSDEWKRFVATPTQDALFGGLDKQLTDLAHKTLPLFGQGLSGVATGLNTNIKQIISSLGNDKNTSLLSRIFGDTQGGLQNASRGINGLLHGFLQLTSSSASFLPRLGDAATKVFNKFDAWTTKVSNDGSLNKWIDNGLKAVDALGRSVGNIGSIISSISRAFDTASGHTGGFVTNLDHATQRLADFLKTSQGQGRLIGYFKQAGEFTQTLIQAYRDAKPFLHDLISTTREWSGFVLESVGSLLHLAAAIERNTGLIKPLVFAYLTFSTVKPIIEGVIGVWKTYSTVMGAIARQGGAGGVVSGAFTETKNKMASLGNAAEEAGAKVAKGPASLGGALKGLAGVIGPGLAFAAAVGGAEFAIHQLGVAHEKAAQQARDQATALDQLKGSLDQVTGAVTQETLAQTSKSLQSYSIPGLGNRNILQDIGRTGAATPQQFLQATNPVNQNQRTELLGKLDEQTEQKVEQSDYWRKYGHIWQSDGVDVKTLSLAAAGDTDALNKVRAAETKMFGAARDQLGNRPGYEKAQILGGRGAPSLTELDKSIGTPDSITSAIALRNTTGAFVASAAGTQAATEAANGRGQLNDSGNSRYGGLGVSGVFINSQGDAVVETDRQPSVDDADGQVSKLANGRWQVTLTDAATARDVQKLASGGLVTGVGGPTDDMNLVAMSSGEHVAQAKAVDYYGPKLFDDLNNMRIPKHVTGGFQLAPPNPLIPQPPTPEVPAPPAITAPLGPPVPETTFGGALSSVGPPITSTGGLATPDVLSPFAGAGGTGGGPTGTEIGNAPAPSIPAAPSQGFNFGGADSGLGRLNGTGSVLDQTLTPKLPLTTGLAPGEKPYAGAKSLAPGSLSGLEASVNPRDLVPITPPTKFGSDSWRRTPDATTPASSIGRGGTAAGGNSAFDAYMKVRNSGPIDSRLDEYWRGKGFDPTTGEAAPASKSLTLPHVQTPVTPGQSDGAVPLGNTPIYSYTPGPAGPVIAPSGPVMGQMRSAIDSLVGTPYVWGGFGAGGVDCSGLASVVANIASGRPAFSSRFDTHSELGELTSRGFLPGKGGPGMLTIGWNEDHTAITLPDGTAVSSGEKGGVQYGGGGSDESQFNQFMHLPVDSDALDALSDPATLGAPALNGQLGGGVPAFLQPENLFNFFGSQAQNVGQGVAGIGLQLFQGLTGLNLGPLLGEGQQLGNGAIGALGGKGGLGGLLGGGGTGLNALAGADLGRYVNGQLPLGASPGSSANSVSYTPGGGAEQWRPVVRQVLNSVGPKYGITPANEKAWEDAIVKQIGTESQGNPNSVNARDSNGRGGAQQVGGLLNFLPATFNSNNILGGSFMDPQAQIAAAIPYVVNKFGVNSDGSPKGIGLGHGFKSGGYPNGSALVSSGEFITNSKATSHYGSGLYNALNSMSVPKKFLGGFADGGFPLDIPGLTQPAPGQAAQSPGPLPTDAPAPAAPMPNPTQPGDQQQAPGPLDLGQAPQVAGSPSTGGPPGSGAPAPAPDPGTLPEVAAKLAGAMPGTGGGSGGGLAQPGATPSADGAQPRATLGAAPKSQEHTNPAISKGIQGAASTVGAIASMAASMALNGVAPGAGSAAGAGIQAGAQMAGQVATAAVNVLSSLLVGTATNGSTQSASGVPLLPNRQPMQSGVPQINQRNHYGDIHVSNLDQFKRQQQLMDAQDSMPYVGHYGA